MSDDAGEPRPPRRPRQRPAGPSANPGPRRAPGPDDNDEGQTTWHPAPKPVRPAAAAGGGTRRGRGAGQEEPRSERGGPNWFERIVFGSVSTGHLTTFCRQFASYLDAGVDLLRALGSLRSQFARTALGPVIERLSLAVRRGQTLADAMAREPQAFDPLLLSMMRVAEARGGVPETLRRMANQYEARQRLLRQARSAMIYPLSVLIIAGGVVALLTLFVLPRMISALEMDRGDLPLPTRMLIGLTHFMQVFGWWLIPIGLVVGGFLLLRAYRTAGGKRVLDGLALRVPVFGPLLREIDTSRFARTLSALLDAGVDYGSSLELTADVLRMAPLRETVRDTRKSVLRGVELSRALDLSGRFPHDVVEIVRTGEETGKLPETLEKMADQYEERVSFTVKNLGYLLQPLLFIFLGGIVLFIALAFVMAYVSMLQSAMRM